METATRLAGEVYAVFMQEVVEQHVLAEREGVLSEENYQRLAKKTHIDTRVIRLMAISGKGGWSADPEKRQRFAVNTNVTLMDHLLSVIRGALLLYALDKLGQNQEMDEGLLRRRLRIIAIIAFLHDLDKLLQLERNTRLPLEEIEAALKRYGINAFLGTEITLTSEQIRYLIELVEDTQRHRSPPVELPPRDYEPLMAYVALADKLDSIWLSTDPEKGGLRGVLDYLGNVRTLCTDLLRQWQALDIFDPHHPFLLDELQRWLSLFSLRVTGIPPLLEVHHDGRLFMLLPMEKYEAVVEKSIQRLSSALPFELELKFTNRSTPELFNGHPDHAGLQEFITRKLPWSLIKNLFCIQVNLKEKVEIKLQAMLMEIGLAPRWPEKIEKKLVPMFITQDNMSEQARELLYKAAHIALLMNFPPKPELPSFTDREQELIAKIGKEPPAWIKDIKDKNSPEGKTSYSAILALWATKHAFNDTKTNMAIWEDQGLLQEWFEGKKAFEGNSQRKGIRETINDKSKGITEALQCYLGLLLKGKLIETSEKISIGRCIYCDAPVKLEKRIEETDGLYGLKASAFSGRDGRPETFNLTHGHTNVCSVCYAELKLRSNVLLKYNNQANPTKQPSPALVFSPATSGLFGGLTITDDKNIRNLSTYELCQKAIEKGKLIYEGLGIYGGRYHLARLENLSDRLYIPKQGNKPKTGQIIQLQRLLQACRRLGRPLHVFRGLPTLQQAFFYYDAMPRVLADLVGGNSLRLEQLPGALQQLQCAQILLEAPGLGYDVLRLYATPATRFGITCLAWCHLHDELKEPANARELGSLRFALRQLEYEFEQQSEDYPMSEHDGALVRLGRAAVRIQRHPPYLASTNEEMLVFKTCFDFLDSARTCHQTDVTSLIHGIANDLETDLRRKDKIAASRHRDGRSLREECLTIAEMFVHDIWHGVLKQRPPTQRIRRTLGSIYRMAFLQAVRNQSETPVDKTPA
ncbi:MAG: hypothetical protein U1F76_23485 [Candidatus Competibacteraceae bacterium]